MTMAPSRSRGTLDRVASALLWLCAFAFASGIFLSLTMLFRGFPPAAPVAVGRVTIERVSKLKDYVTAFAFLAFVPPLTVWLHGIGQRVDLSFRRRMAWSEPGEELLALSTVLFATPFLLSPLLYLTTNKAGWILLLPPLISQLGPRTLIAFREKRWLRHLFAPELRGFHALIVVEAMSWICFRYIATGKRVAHIPTLFLESVFVLFLVAAFWGAIVLASRLAANALGGSPEQALGRMAVAALPFVLLPAAAVFLAPPLPVISACFLAFLILAVLAFRKEWTPDAATIRRLVMWVIVPALLYIVSYASTASLSQWIDLFHRGEALGPASDYLRGKAPYREVFVLHGLLEDGLLDAWLMQLFGRHLEVALARPVVIGSFLAPSLWFLGVALFDSIPLAAVAVSMGSWTTAENDRTFFQVAVVALLWYGLRERKAWAAAASGVFVAMALFFSYEIGLYSVAGALASIAAIGLVTDRGRRWSGLPLARAATLFVCATITGAAPFLAFLALRGSLFAFAETSFVTIPGIIDAVWSLPFPDLISGFRRDLNLHTIADFILFEKFHLILSFLTIAVALAYLIRRRLNGRLDSFDLSLLVMTLFAAITQRSALGRAEFRHQYFSAFLIGPMLVMLVALLLRRVRVVWQEGGGGTRAFVVTAAMSAAVLVAVLLWIPELVNARLNDVVRYQSRVRRMLRDPAADRVLDRITAVSDAIDDMTGPKDPIFDFSNQPALYFFADRMNPTRFYQVPILSPAAFQAETIAALDRTKPRLIIVRSPEGFDRFDGVPNSLRAQAVAGYIGDCYSFARNVRGVELWTRKADAPPLNSRSYLSRIRLPSPQDINESGRAQQIFPSLGSLAGIDAYWRSDLVMHNPFREPLTVNLRYLSELRKADREVTVAPGMSVQWTDVIRTLFDAPETYGMLWIEHRADRAPVCRVKIYDSLHESKAAVYAPLSVGDSANADSQVKDLTLVGIDGGGTRRVNVGVVNVGDLPASFRITARDRNGRRIGKVLLRDLAEDSPYMLNDAATALGVVIDEGVSVRVELKSGMAIAYASVTDSSTHDTQIIPAVPSLHP
ncbi:MAG TPA: hypothetical protein VEZ11_08130 [Thermoanaerobaculia bacterium]|nr:hypothetical protein [Thermoanaerobaculia bacterium]